MDQQLLKKPNPPEPAFPNLPGMPEMLQSLVPRQIPQLEYQSGVLCIIDGFFHNWKLKQMERDSERRAQIAENTNRLREAQFEGVLQLLTFGERYQTYVMRQIHERRMMEIEELKGEAEVDKVRMGNLLSKAEYDRLIAETKVITFQLEDRRAVETENGKE